MGLSTDAATSPRQTVTVIDNRTGKQYEFPITHNSLRAIDFKKLTAPRRPTFGSDHLDREEDETESGLRVHDPGFMNTTVLESKITWIHGEKGILRYRGYPIEQLAESSNHLEASYLLIYGHLPSKEQFRVWQNEILHHSYVHEDMTQVIRAHRYDSHPMLILSAGFASLGAFAPEANPSLQGQKLYTRGYDSLAIMDKQIYRIMGKAITLAAMSYRVRQGRPFNRPPSGLSYSGTFLYLLDTLNEREYRPNPVFEKALDVLFLLHADHELNASCATGLQVGSTLADPYSVVAAACAALSGPLHGGANQSVVEMLQRIGSPDKVPEFMEKVKAKKEVLSGFGHRVYKTTDPRSKVIRKVADDVFKLTGRSPLLDTALALNEAANKDDYFVSRKLGANVDYWSGLIYTQIGFPTDMFTVIFAVARVAGWLAHWRQMMLQQKVTIWRPRQIYVGEAERDYVPIEERSSSSTLQMAGEEDRTLAPVPVHHGGDSRRRRLASYVDETGKRVVGGSRL